jgi:hypothetical protein
LLKKQGMIAKSPFGGIESGSFTNTVTVLPSEPRTSTTKIVQSPRSFFPDFLTLERIVPHTRSGLSAVWSIRTSMKLFVGLRGSSGFTFRDFAINELLSRV